MATPTNHGQENAVPHEDEQGQLAELVRAQQATLEDLVSAMAVMQRTITHLTRRVEALERHQLDGTSTDTPVAHTAAEPGADHAQQET